MIKNRPEDNVDNRKQQRKGTLKQRYEDVRQKIWPRPEKSHFMESQRGLFEVTVNGCWKLAHTKILLPWTGNDSQYMQHVEISSSKASTNEPPLILLHGYGPPSGTFSRIIFDLSAHFNVYALDWLGWGGSSKPEFCPKTREEAEDWHVESLEKWREAQGFKKMNLCGHSLGAYMATVYALKYPEKVNKLVLLSPVGLPEGKAPSLENAKINPVGRFLLRTGTNLWKKGYTPHEIINKSGHTGVWLIRNYVEKRFSYIKDRTEQDDEFFTKFEPYLYNSFYGCSSGFACLNLILSPGAWAHAPLINRIGKLKVPVDFVYGQYDWMSVDAAQQAANLLRSEPGYHYKPSVAVVPGCGHQLAIVNPKGVVEEIKRIFGYSKN